MASSMRRIPRRPAALALTLVLASSAGVAGQETPPSLVGYGAGEVEQGVWRVDSDGIRDLARPYDQTPPRTGIVAGADGSVWLLRPGEHLRLGGPAIELDRPRRPRPDTFAAAAVGADGRLWWTAKGLHVHDGTEWSTVREAPRRGTVGAVRVLPDGRILATWSLGSRTKVGWLDDDGWTLLPRRLRGFGDDAAADGEDVLVSTVAPTDVWRYDGSGWAALTLPDGEPQVVAFADDGTFWVRLLRLPDVDDGTPEPVLAYWDGDSWTIYRAAHRIPASGTAFGGFGTHAVGPDGSLWFPARDATAGPLEDCDGIARFDRRSVSWHLRDHCVHDLDVGPDGGVWLLASRPGEAVDGELTEIGPVEVFHIPPG